MRVVVAVAPIAISVVVVTLASQVVPRPPGLQKAVLWWASLSVLSTATVLSLDRVFRRLLPVVALFNLSLVFPDRAPSRFKSALRTGTVRQLQRAMESGEFSEYAPQEAAEQLIGLASKLSAHDRLTRGHTERVRAFSVLIGEEMGLGGRDLEMLNWSGLVHDIGKLMVPAEVLNKVGKPTDDEWAILRQHPVYADKLIEPLRPWLGKWAESATEHHERWDGKGYPRGIGGKDIGLAGRIVAVADAYDVMTSARSYKKPMPTAAARQELVDCSGTQFDPDVVRAFLTVGLGRLRLVAGPLGSLAQLPAGGASLGTGVVTGASAATSMAVAAVGGALHVAPVPDTAPAGLARVTIEAPAYEVAGFEDISQVANLTVHVSEEGRTVSLVGDVENGEATVAEDGTVSLVPDADFHGVVPVTYRLCDEQGECSDGTITFVVEPVNDPPTSKDDLASVNQGEVVTLDVLANDDDIDDDHSELQITDVEVVSTRGSNLEPESLTTNGNGIVLRVAPEAEGLLLLRYTVTDPSGETSESLVRITVVAINGPPVANDEVISVVEATPTVIDVLANDTDPDNDTLSISSIGDVTSGTATIEGSAVLFVPVGRYVGAASFTYTVVDGGGETSSASVSIDIVDDPERPNLPEDTVSLSEDTVGRFDVVGDGSEPTETLDTTSLVIDRVALNGTISVSDGKVVFTPNRDWVGTDSFDYFVCDVAGFCGTATTTISVGQVNDPPSFAAGSDLIVLASDGAHLIEDWATSIRTGPSNEKSQSVAFSLVTANPGLFSAVPAVSASGDLTFTPAVGATGQTSVTVTLSDSGGTGSGGVDTSQPAVFDITVNDVNDPPSFLAGDDITVPEDSPAQGIAEWATAITPGPADESSQTVSFTVTVSNPDLFAVTPSISATGELTFTPAADAVGTSEITVTLADSGGTATGGSDTSVSTVSTITMTAVNDPPTFGVGDPQTVAEDSGSHVSLGWATNISAGPIDEEGQQVTFSVTAATPSAFTTQPAISPTGDLTFEVAADATGTQGISITATDDGGGADTSAAVDAEISITAVNDPPVANDDAGPTFTTVEDNTFTTGDVAGNDFDVDSAVDATSVVVVSGTTDGNLTNNGDGTFDYAPDADFFGADTFTYT
ncbi:MAG: tandem-95 repeat protein, partial [Actinomycetia bacterium]|nr:tandem-95 repeat protein [Actinomycetes bacterium]